MKRVLLCAILMSFSTLASAVVYKWVDAQGKTLYGDRPPDGVRAEVVELLGTHTSRSTAQAPAPAKAPSNSSATPPSEEKKAVDNDVAQSRDKQCAEAQDRYKKLIEGRRLYKTGDNGERQYLTSDEIDSERLNAKRELDSICNSPT
jgi:Domain of unknown function (DUF4124)